MPPRRIKAIGAYSLKVNEALSAFLKLGIELIGL